MKIQHETVKYYIEDALVEIEKILKACKDRTLEDADILVNMEHALHMLNFAYNARYLTREEIDRLTQEEWERYTQIPDDFCH